MAIQQTYNDGKKHVHVLSFGAGTQSTALLLMALNGEINGVVPDHIIFSDTGWEPKEVYDWLEKIQKVVMERFGKEIAVTDGGSIRDDVFAAAAYKKGIDKKRRFASLPYFTSSLVPVYKDNGFEEVEEDDPNQTELFAIDEFEAAKKEILGYKEQLGMVLRQCTQEYKIAPVTKKIRELLGYQPRQRVKEIVHLWKGISTDEISRVKPSRDKWIVAEHPLIDIANVDRTACIKYVEDYSLGTPPKSSCIGCPFHDDHHWLDMKTNHPAEFEDAVLADKAIRNMSHMRATAYLHRSCKPLDEVDFAERIAKKQGDGDLFDNECEGMCGV
jgi:hypothetical protein